MQLPTEVELIECEDFKIFVDPIDENISQAIARRKVWEPITTEHLKKTLKKTDTFVDVGANIGWYTLLASKYCRIVHAFEPSPQQFQYLWLNTRSLSNVTIYPFPLWSSPQMLGFQQGPKVNSGDSKTRAIKPEDDISHTTILSSTTLDSMFEPNTVDVMKIDAQGADHEVLKGASTLIKNTHSLLLVIEEGIEGDYIKELGLTFVDHISHEQVHLYAKNWPSPSVVPEWWVNYY